ncbi:MAG: hypothetical protein WCS98_07250 [Bacillota bacterium]|nr:hypothetical protein [Bacillota bacterium]MDD3297890.1 hypothetical protein [Bacillota bacterium]MDD4707693.1 hypothetical protein [Bacillota bacterium]
MKKLGLALLLISMMVVLAACSSGEAPQAPEEPAGTEQREEAAGENAAGEKGKESAPTYKETMVPFDQLVPAGRIVILQNTLNYSREGFYNADNKPAAEDIEYNGDTVAAYPITYALDFLTKGSNGDLIVTNNDGRTQTISAQDFAGLYAIIDFTSDASPALYNPESGTEITDFLFATTTEGEAIYSVVSGSIYNAAEVIANVGWDTGATYRYMATDKFYIPVGPDERATGEIRGTLSGAVNGSFPDLKIAGGKINDVIYIEAME